MLKRKYLVMAIFASVAAVSASTAFAATNGFYAGIQMGYTNTHYSANDFIDVFLSDDTPSGFGMRGLLGYQFTRNLALEGGYLRYGNATFDNMILTPGATPVNAHVAQSAWDIGVKGILPLIQCANVYAKVGMAYVQARPRDALSGIDDINKWRPTYGIGGGYDVTQYVSVDVSWNRVAKGSGIQNADFIALGADYHFG